MRKLNDWLENYMRFTQRTEPPKLYHLWSGIAAISSALRRKCYCNWGSRGYIYPNLYIALVGPPGGRKGTAMKVAKKMVQSLQVPIGADSLGSTQALYRELMDSENSYTEVNGLMRKHKSVSIWAEEFQVFLSDRDLTLIASLTDLFDCADSWKYKTLKRKTEDISNCWLTIIGAITPSLLQSKLSQDAVGGGLLSRIIFVVGYGPEQKIALTFHTEEEEKLEKTLTQDLQSIAQLTGPFKLDNSFLKNYIRWYENAPPVESLQNDKFLGYASRRALHLNKLCMIVCASESNDMVIMGHHFEKALAILEITENEMSNAFYGLGMATKSNTYTKILDYIKTTPRFTLSEILREFHLDIDNLSELKGYLEMAEQSGFLSVESSITSTVYNGIIQHKPEKKGENYLDQTVFRLMDNSIQKRLENKNE